MQKILLMIIFISTLALGQTADEIIKEAEDAVKGENSSAVIVMTIKTKDYTRMLEMESWWIGNNKALIVTKAPKKEAGNKTLKIGNEMWSYLHNTETTIKIPPSMMLQSWNGSDFTNDDLVRESNLNRDYDANVIAKEKIAGEESWKIELIPKPDAPVVWGKIYYWVRKSDYLPALVQYYDEKGKMIRYMTYTDIKIFHGKILPGEWTMYSKTEDERKTMIKLKDIRFDVQIPERKFSFQELESGN